MADPASKALVQLLLEEVYELTAFENILWNSNGIGLEVFLDVRFERGAPAQGLLSEGSEELPGGAVFERLSFRFDESSQSFRKFHSDR